MSLNDIQLPGNVIAGLFAHTLVEDNNPVSTPAVAPAQPPPAPPPPAPAAKGTVAWKKLGNNLKNILIIVDYPASAHLPDEELSFLTNMLSACKLSLDDVAVINLNNYTEKVYKPLVAHFNAQIVMLFGVAPRTLSMPLEFPLYQVQSFAGTTYLYAQAMEERHTDSLLKSRLWVSLRTLFKL